MISWKVKEHLYKSKNRFCHIPYLISYAQQCLMEKLALNKYLLNRLILYYNFQKQKYFCASSQNEQKETIRKNTNFCFPL